MWICIISVCRSWLVLSALGTWLREIATLKPKPEGSGLALFKMRLKALCTTALGNYLGDCPAVVVQSSIQSEEACSRKRKTNSQCKARCPKCRRTLLTFTFKARLFLSGPNWRTSYTVSAWKQGPKVCTACIIGALIITYTISGVPYYSDSII